MTKNNTKVTGNRHAGSVKLYSTTIVKWDAQRIELETNGWRTNVTKDRMNQASQEFGLGFSVFQRKGDWFVTFNGVTSAYGDGITFNRTPAAQPEVFAYKW